MVSVARHTYEPRGMAREVYLSRDPEILLSGPAGTGKSRAILEKLLIIGLQSPRVRMLAVRQTERSLVSTGMVTWREHVAAECLALGAITYYGGSSREPAAYIFQNGSRLCVGGMDKPGKVMSSEYDIIYVQEATDISLTAWESLTTRLRNGRISFQQMIADCNPGPPTHWLKRRCDAGATRIVYARHSDNPVLINPRTGKATERGKKYLASLDRLTGVRRQRLRDGIWAAAEGLVYDTWDPTIHLINQRTIPVDWDRVWGIDFGYTNPFVLQCWAISPDGWSVLYREIYRTRRTVAEHAAHILRIVRSPSGEWLEPRPVAIVCDHDAEDRETLRKELGIKTVAADKRVSAGIGVVKDRLTSQYGRVPRIRVMRDALVERDPELADAGLPTCTQEEVLSYVWPETTGEKERPVKEDDHGMDTMRYVQMYLHDRRRRPGHPAPLPRSL